MGILKLADLIRDKAPEAINQRVVQDYRGCTVALDAFISMYQLRTGAPEILNRNGENTSDLMGFFYRTVHLLENGIKPLYVFDGHPPELKSPVLDRRAEAAGFCRKAERGLSQTSGKEQISADSQGLCTDLAPSETWLKGLSQTSGKEQISADSQGWCTDLAPSGTWLKGKIEGTSTQEEAESPGLGISHPPELIQPETGFLNRRYVENCQKILRLLGVPYIEAQSEAEATCAALVKCGKADYTATEDMDALPFGSRLLLRNLRVEKNCVVEEYSLPKVLEQLKLTHEQFVDLCILLGCDYCGKIYGLGPKRALKLMQKYKSIEEIEKHINLEVHPLPENWQYREARRLLLHPSVTSINDVMLQWAEPDEEGLVKFLSHEKYIKEERVRRRLEKLRKAQQPVMPATPSAGNKRQRRLDEYFPIKKAAAAAATTKVQKGTSRTDREKGKGKKRKK